MSASNEDVEDMEMEEDDELDYEDGDYSDDSLEPEDAAGGVDLRMTESTTESAPSVGPPQEEEATVARRQQIMAIMRHPNLSDQEKRLQIHAIMNSSSHASSPASPPSSQLSGAATAVEGNTVCVHYERNCSIVAPCCNRIFGCRICHDELSPAGHPPINRYLIREVVCKSCNTQQNATYVPTNETGLFSCSGSAEYRLVYCISLRRTYHFFTRIPEISA
jgi:uncharacterized CHY-type Zn-finger protein